MSARSSLLVPCIALLCGAAIAAGLLALRHSRMPSAPLPTMQTMDSQSAAPTLSSAAETGAAAAQDAKTTAVFSKRAQSEQPRGDLDPVEARGRIEANIALLDARFAAEPLDSAWAAREERALHEFFAPDALAAQGLRAPAGFQAGCHRATCRISARFSDPIEAEMTTQRLAMHVAARLPYGAVMPRMLNDGSIQIDAWYSAARIVL